MKKRTPQNIVLTALIAELKSNGCQTVTGNTKFSDLSLPVEIPESIRLRFSFTLGLPSLPDHIINKIPVNFHIPLEFRTQGPKVDMNLTVRKLSISITLWYMKNHQDKILALTSN